MQGRAHFRARPQAAKKRSRGRVSPWPCSLTTARSDSNGERRGLCPALQRARVAVRTHTHTYTRTHTHIRAFTSSFSLFFLFLSLVKGRGWGKQSRFPLVSLCPAAVAVRVCAVAALLTSLSILFIFGEERDREVERKAQWLKNAEEGALLLSFPSSSLLDRCMCVCVCVRLCVPCVLSRRIVR